MFTRNIKTNWIAWKFSASKLFYYVGGIRCNRKASGLYGHSSSFGAPAAFIFLLIPHFMDIEKVFFSPVLSNLSDPQQRSISNILRKSLCVYQALSKKLTSPSVIWKCFINTTVKELWAFSQPSFIRLACGTIGLTSFGRLIPSESFYSIAERFHVSPWTLWHIYNFWPTRSLTAANNILYWPFIICKSSWRFTAQGITKETETSRHILVQACSVSRPQNCTVIRCPIFENHLNHRLVSFRWSVITQYNPLGTSAQIGGLRFFNDLNR